MRADGEGWISVLDGGDVAVVVTTALGLCRLLGWEPISATAVATAASELANNIVVHAGSGVVSVRVVMRAGRRGVEVEARDEGPGIDDVARALTPGFSTAGTLGMGLPGVGRLMDELIVESVPRQGVRVVARKWQADA